MSQTPITEVSEEERNTLFSFISSLPYEWRLRYHVEKYRTLMPAFQVMSDSYVYKVVLMENHVYLGVIDCREYRSKSGLTFEFCMDKNGRIVRGLWITNRNLRKLTLESNKKIWRNASDVTIEYMPSWASLVHVTNYGYSIYENAVKAPTLKLPVEFKYENLSVHSLSFSNYKELAFSDELQKVEMMEMHGYNLVFGKPVYRYRNIIVTLEKVAMSIDSKNWEMIPGVYLILHSPSRS